MAALFVFLLIGLYQCIAVSTDTLCSLSTSLNKEGFHRELVTSVKLILLSTSKLRQAKCTSVVKMTFPSGAYVDPYQVNNLQSLQVLFESPIDIETPEYTSPNQTLLAYIELLQTTVKNEFTAELVLPIHLRYHRPEYSDHLATVKLGPPEAVFTNCSDETYTPYELQCSPTNIKLCTWTKLNCETSMVTATIPVGNLEHLPAVAVVTVLTTVCSTALLIYQITQQYYKSGSKIL